MLRGSPLYLLLALALTTPFWDLGHPLIEVDDARYAEVPREMVASGDWATPRLNGMDYVEKPPLWYWLAAASYSLFGVSEAAARLPLALLALAGILGAAWLGSWLFSARTGVLAAVALSSAGLYFFHAHYMTPDMALSVSLLWCSGLILRSLLKPEDSAWAGPGAWSCAGLAFLSKGLVALVFPLGWALGLWILLPRSRRNFQGLLRPAGPLLFAGIVLPWFATMESRHPGFLRFFFGEHHFQRYLTPKYDRVSPWYFFLLVGPAGLLPWTPAALAGIWAGLRGWRREPVPAALALWILLIAAFFSVSKSKLASYILPVVPHAALLAAWALEKPLAAWARRLSLGLGALLAAAALGGLAAAAGGWSAETLGAAGVSTPSAVAAAAAVLALGAALIHGHPATLALAGLLLGGACLAGLRLNETLLSARPLAAAISRGFEPGDLVYSYGVYLHGIPFYTRRPVDRLVNWVGELQYGKRDGRNARRFGDDDSIRALPLPGRRVFVVLRRFETPHLKSLARPGSVKTHGGFGKWELAVIE